MAWIEKKKKKAPRKSNQFRDEERRAVYQSLLWRRLRSAKLMEQPLCEVCDAEGRIRYGDHVHHIRSFVGISDPVKRDAVAYDLANLMTVCETCHGRIHGGDLKGCSGIEDIKKRAAK